VTVDPKFSDWLGEQTTTLFSMAGSGERYVACQVAPGTGVHLQVKGGVSFEESWGRTYGAALDIGNAELNKYLAANVT
jgi:hypothetical protein